ncbi:RNA-binding domain-containing protein [Lacinutrix undariae]
MSETNRIEYKRELSKKVDLEKEVIAFLNSSEGGEIYIGINAHGVVYGVPNLDAEMLKIKDIIKNNIQPSCLGLFDIIAIEKEGDNLIKIIVSSGTEKPYYKRKKGMTPEGSFIRIGTAAEPMTQKMVDELYAKRTRNSIGKIASPQQDLDFEQLRIYYQEKSKPLNKQFAKNLELETVDHSFNYAAYLLADKNNLSIKVAKYLGKDRVTLSETNEYGYNSLIKACKNVLDKINIENSTSSLITAKERKDQRLWNPIALREAIINAFVHNDFTREVPPKFEIFSDRIEITSTGSLPDGLSEKEFFEGYSIPRNKELIRIFKDLELVEQLGSGIPRIIAVYPKDCFHFSDNFLRISLPKIISNQEGNQEGNQDKTSYILSNEDLDKYIALVSDVLHKDKQQHSQTIISKYTLIANKLTKDEVAILKFAYHPKKKKEILEDCLGISNQTKNFKHHTDNLLSLSLLRRTLPNTPTSKLQKYYTTEGGKICLSLLENDEI